MRLVVGLGNPGQEYEETRHNAGFCVIDLLGTEFGADFRKKKTFFGGADFEYARVRIGREEIVLLKPLTYMNRSGNAVKACLDWFKIPATELVVIHDDVSLPLGKIRVQRAGGAGGQHGVESIIEQLGGSQQFDRLKLGIGPDPGGHVRHKYVLGKIPEKDRDLFDSVLKLSAEAVKTILRKGPQFAANQYNGRNLAEPEKKKKEPKTGQDTPLTGTDSTTLDFEP